jgi:Mn-dependent DtxR family transcriptional regulator
VIVMALRMSGEDYLEAIMVLQREKGAVRSVDVARHMGFSKPSISHAVATLEKDGYLTVDEHAFLHLTPEGRQIAETIYERHVFFRQQLLDAGVDAETAEHEACLMEHAISAESFAKLKKNYRPEQGNA